ncbi:MAG: RnfABCDGE type electron transport complex subunit B [Clostridia bacterium]|nr:RnfABCDGE type electron transport complex subunit B [Clostridia bacterium]
MNFMDILTPALIVGGIGLFFGALLAVAGIIFKVKKDERIPLIEETLPGANCGGCGYAGCSAYAEAVAAGEAHCDLCSVGGEAVASYIAEIMGEKSEFVKKFAFVGCEHGAADRYVYEGVQDCVYAAQLSGGPKSCTYGCIGLGNCVKVCPTAALSMVDGNPHVERDKCTGCGACMRACPRGLIRIVPEKAKLAVSCNSHDKGAVMRNTCPNGCIGCGKCERVCTNGAIKVVDNLAQIDYDKCVACGKCLESCPKKIIKYII